MHMRFSNKIPKYSQVSVPPLIGQKSPAEQRFVGGVFALSACYIGKAAGLLCCLRVSALFALWLIWLAFNNRWLWSVGIRCFFRLQIRFPVRSPVLSPARGPALSPTWSCARGPTSTSEWHRLVRLVLIFRCKLLRLDTRVLSIYTAGARLSLPVIHAPALGSHISTSEASALHSVASAASALHCCTWALEASTTSTHHPGASTTSAGHRPTLYHHVPASKALAAWAHASAYEALAESTRPRPWALPALDVLI